MLAKCIRKIISTTITCADNQIMLGLSHILESLLVKSSVCINFVWVNCVKSKTELPTFFN